MVVFNYSGAEINAKVVYYGPALSGKTTNLEFIYEKMPSNAKGKMVSMKTRTDRTLFFDFLPLELGEINGYRTRILLYTVPGQVYYNATRKLVLKGADAVVFVADSTPSKIPENIESLRNLEENLNEYGLTLDTIPWVMQYNKRDLPDALPVQALASKLNLLNVPSFEAVATTGSGIYETFQSIAGMLYNQLAERLRTVQPAPKPGQRAPDPPSRPKTQPIEATVVEQPISDVLDAALREVDENEQTPLTPEAAPEHAMAGMPTETPARQVDVPETAIAQDAATALPAQPDASDPPVPQTGFTNESLDQDFQFESLEEEKMLDDKNIDDTVGRVIDFEDTQTMERPAQMDGEFIINPFQSSSTKKEAPQPPPPEKKLEASPATPYQEQPEKAQAPSPEKRPEPVPAAPLPTHRQPPPATKELAVTVPVVISRSQMKKTIPVKLTLEIQVVDDER